MTQPQTQTVYGYVDSSGFVYPATTGRPWSAETLKNADVRPITDIVEYKELVERNMEREDPNLGMETLVEVETRVEREARQRHEEQTTGTRTRTKSAERDIKMV